jgi:hypothetical protein
MSYSAFGDKQFCDCQNLNDPELSLESKMTKVQNY